MLALKNTNRKLIKLFASLLMFGVFALGGGGFAYAGDKCAESQIDVKGDGSLCQDAHFSVTTTKLSSGNEFKFKMSATGTFYVDCGADGALSAEDKSVDGKTITRSDTSESTYTCSYSNKDAETKTISFGGVADGYSDDTSKAAIRFGEDKELTPDLITGVSGNMSAMFPWNDKDNAYGAQPRFCRTFSGATNLTSIDANLFANLKTGTINMFYRTFADCSSLTSVPWDLFRIEGSGVYGMFQETFANSGLTAIPDNLFAGITGGADMMFSNTFESCYDLGGYIPASAFAGLINNGSPNVMNMWNETFHHNPKLATTCDLPMGYYPTGYEGVWGGKVSCMDPVKITLGTDNAATPAEPSEVWLAPKNAWLANKSSTTTLKSLTSLPTTKQENASFLGFWYKQEKGEEIQVIDGNGNFINDSFTTEEVTLQPKFGTIYNVTYSCGEGTGTPGSDTAMGGEDYTPFDGGKVCSRPGYGFGGWAVSGTKDIVTGTFTWNYTEDKILTADWKVTGYSCGAGYYLNAKADCEMCPQGSYCPGISGAQYTGTPQGIYSCSYATNGEYQFSVDGQTDISQCYRACTTADVPHSTAVGGNAYYGGLNKCGAKECEKGYDMEDGVCVEPGYKIIYVLGDGKNYEGAPERYTQSAGAVINGIPTLYGFAFMGWCTDEKMTDCAMQQTIPANSTGDRTFYAKWEAGTYRITLDVSGADTGAVPSSIYMKYKTGWFNDFAGTSPFTQLSVLPTRANMMFTGFYTKPNGGDKQIIDSTGNIVADPTVFDRSVTIYADFHEGVTVRYSCGTGVGTAPADDVALFKYNFTPAANTCTNVGHRFIGWQISGTDKIVNDTFSYNYEEGKTLTAVWTQSKFTIVTTSVKEDFKFALSAQGTFTVDCGADGTLVSLDSNDVSGNVIDRSNKVGLQLYRCDYKTGGAKIINFDGLATGYYPDEGYETPAISFSGKLNASAGLIASVSGDLSAIFPYIPGNSDEEQPNFSFTFNDANQLTAVPDTLFADYTRGNTRMFGGTFQNTQLKSVPAGLFNRIATPADSMFRGTFYGTQLKSVPTGLFGGIKNGAANMFDSTFASASLTSIPEGLFSSITNGADGMFAYTFQNTKLKSVPAGLFGGIKNGAANMFDNTFAGTSLTSIPEGLFSSITNGADSMFRWTFAGTSLTSIPEGLFSGIKNGADSMFSGTFANNTKLKSVPAGLFSNITTGANGMFAYTFQGCAELTEIPADLFSGITTAADNMFEGTFYNAYSLGGYIPPTTFAGLIANGSPYATNMFNNTYSFTKVWTSCNKMKQYITGYEGDAYGWGAYVSCVDTKMDPIAVTFSAEGADMGAVPSMAYMFFDNGWYSDSIGKMPIDKLTELPTKWGSVFRGFYSGEHGTGIQVIDKYGNFVNTTFTMDPTATIYAAFGTPYNVTYSCGTGAGEAPNASVAFGGLAFTIADNYGKCYKPGYEIAGWAISGTNDVVQAGDTIIWNYTGNKTLTPIWEGILFWCEKGNYLGLSPKGDGSIGCFSCPAGSYCPGVYDIQYSGSEVGIYSCSDETSGAYPSSKDGSDSISQCYRACATTDIDHATEISGAMFYDGTNTCELTACESGYAPAGGVNHNDQVSKFKEYSSYGLMYVNNDGQVITGDKDTTYLTTNGNNSFVVGFGKQGDKDYEYYGQLRGFGRCSTREAKDTEVVAELADEVGKDGAKYCYCNLTDYAQKGDYTKISSDWIFATTYKGDKDKPEAECANQCAYECAQGIASHGALWKVIETIKSDSAQCAPATYNIHYVENCNKECEIIGAPTSYTYGTDQTLTGIMVNPMKGYILDGWCTGYDEKTGEYSGCTTLPTISASDSGDKTFYLKWTPASDCGAGTYYNATTKECTTCPENSYCPGGAFSTEGGDAGIYPCSGLANGAYPYSAAGSGKPSECYHACTTADVPHSSAIEPANSYYGSVANTCVPKDCTTGYYPVKGGTMDLNKVIDNADSNDWAWVNYYGKADGSLGAFGLTSSDLNKFALNYALKSESATIYGQARCSSFHDDKDNGSILHNNIDDETGTEGAQYCYCGLTGYDDGKDLHKIKTQWAFTGDTGDSRGCAESCAASCMKILQDQSALVRQTLFANVVEPSMCSGTYGIKYELGCGDKEDCEISSAPLKYEYGAGVTVDTVPSRKDYVFAGWCTDEKLTDCSSTQTVDESEYGPKMLYAKWADATSCEPGNYYDATAGECVICPAGYYCEGGDFPLDGTDQGKSACADLGNGQYLYSAQGASSEYQCYYPCNVGEIANAIGVSGKNYYGSAGATCVPQCAAGYHAKFGVSREELNDFTPTDTGFGGIGGNGIVMQMQFMTGTRGSFAEIETGIFANQPEYSYKNYYSELLHSNSARAFIGNGRCSTHAATNPWSEGNDGMNYTVESDNVVYDLADETGESGAKHCYCNLTGYTTDGELKTMSTPWLYLFDLEYLLEMEGQPELADHADEFCSEYCSTYCAVMVAVEGFGITAYRDRMFNLNETVAPMCTNVYDIMYHGLIEGDIVPDSGMPTTYTYGVGATISGTPTREGWTFDGWCTDETLTNCAMQQTISASESEDKVFFTKWKTSTPTYKITLSSVGADTNASPSEFYEVFNSGWYSNVNMGTRIYEISVPTKQGTMFAGFFTGENGTGQMVINSSGRIEVAPDFFDGDSTIYAYFVEPKFSVTVNGTNRFYSNIGAEGVFAYDCGGDIAEGYPAGGTIYEAGYAADCYYNSNGEHTITIGGLATGYDKNNGWAVIDFGGSDTAPYITSVSGDLSAIFPQNINPRFNYAFRGATNLTTVPNTLFAGYTGGVERMFYETFAESGLTSIPAGLFRNITTGAGSMFYRTFRSCNGLTEIPADLFSNIENVETYMFYGTFEGCNSLGGYIPPTTFAGLIANGSPKASDLFGYTYSGTQVLPTCPDGMEEYDTGYKGSEEGQWGEYVSCIPSNPVQVTLDTSNADTGAAPSTLWVKFNKDWYMDATGNTIFYQLAQLPTTSGAEFLGFWTGVNGTGTQVIDATGKPVTNMFTTEPTTIYAAFGVRRTVTYSCGDGATGTAPASMEIVSGTSTELPLPDKCSRVGYGFAGWAVSGTDDVLPAKETITWPYDEDKTLNAVWSNDVIWCEPGYYYNAIQHNCTKCTMGSYCPGGQMNMGNVDDGIFLCTTENDGEYPFSNSGATSANECYRLCVLEDVAHSTSVIGNVFPGNSDATCSAVTCEAGYNVTSSGSGGIDLNNWENVASSGWKYSASINYYGNWTLNGTTSISEVGLNPGDIDVWGVRYYNQSILAGNALCSLEYNEGLVDSIADETGNADANHCYCNLAKYSTDDGASFTEIQSKWKMVNKYNDGNVCADKCAADCTSTVAGATDVVLDLLSTVTGNNASMATCEGETYSIRYNNFKDTDYVLYGVMPDSYTHGEITVVNAMLYRPGYNFGGWCTDEALTDCMAGYIISEAEIGDKTFWAKWTPNVYTVTLDTVNADTAAIPGTVYLKYGNGWYYDASATNAIASLDTLPTKNGYQFAGFFGGVNGTGTMYVDALGDFVTDTNALSSITQSVTIYAYFSPYYTVKYACGDGNNTFATAQAGETFQVSAPDNCSRPGFTRTGWAVSDSEDVWNDNDTFTWNYTENKTFTAIWAGATFSCPAGTYLGEGPKGFGCNPCPAGYYCEGVESVEYTGVNVGMVECSTLANGAYPSSDEGATGSNMCYGPCVAADVEHALLVVGNHYYGNVGNTCEPLACAAGYHLDGISGGAAPNLMSLVGDTVYDAVQYSHKDSTHFYVQYSRQGAPEAVVPDAGDYVVVAPKSGTRELKGDLKGGCNDLNDGSIYGNAICSTRPGVDPFSNSTYTHINDNFVNEVANETGANGAVYCYCNLDGYLDDCGTSYQFATPWAYVGAYEGYVKDDKYISAEDNCANSCVYACERHMGNGAEQDIAFRIDMFGQLTQLRQSCSDLYKISYKMNGGDNYENAPSTYTYGIGAIISGTPSRKGYDFAGWCTDDGLTQCAMTQTISSSDFGDRVYFAKWTPAIYQVVLNSADATTAAEPSTLYVQYGTGWFTDADATNAIAELTTLPSKAGMNFVGFTTMADGNGTLIIGGTGTLTNTTFATENTTLYAYFSDNIYTYEYSCGEGTGNAPAASTVTAGGSFVTAGIGKCERMGYEPYAWGVSGTNDELLQESEYTWNYTENKVLTALWRGAKFNCEGGFYLNGSTANCEICPAGYYCPGVVEVEFNGTDMGINACEALDDNSYQYSETGSKDAESCYRECVLSDLAIEHVATVAGLMYYGGNNQCKLATCETGYHVEMGKSGASGEIDDLIKNYEQYGATWLDMNGNQGYSGDQTYLVPNVKNSFVAGFGKKNPDSTWNYHGQVRGLGRCSTRAGQYVYETVAELADETGSADANHCYCSLTGYATNGDYTDVHSDWVYRTNYGDEVSCLKSCSEECSGALTNMRETLVGTLSEGGSGDMCVIDTYNINYNLNGGDLPSWDSVPHSYAYGTGATINPTQYPLRSGYQFAGWCSDEQLTDCGTTLTISASETGDRTIYVKWTPNVYTVDIDTSSADTPSDPTRVYLAYATGWYADPEMQNPIATLTTLPTLNGQVFTGLYATDGSDLQVADANGNFITTQSVLTEFDTDATVAPQWSDSTFTVYTSNITANSTFKFALSAAGTFNVNCGEGGTLSSDAGDVSGDTITRTGTTLDTYTCTYSSTGSKTIVFNGTATGYSTNDETPAIAFSVLDSANNETLTPHKVVGLDGTLSVMLPTISANAVPRFTRTFATTNIDQIPGTLFMGYNTSVTKMFKETFANCAVLNLVAPGLFSGITMGADYMFQDTFKACINLQNIQSRLFARITTGATGLFAGTFRNSGLSKIPADLFSGITVGAPSMFSETFSGCANITQINGLFRHITTGAQNMFERTFENCTNVDKISGDLFGGITTGETAMFRETFAGCSALTYMPAMFTNIITAAPYLFHNTFKDCINMGTLEDGLFKGITTGQSHLFDGTFKGCSSLQSVPTDLFANIETVAEYMFSGTFQNTGLKDMPSGLFQGVTSTATGLFQDTFNGAQNMTGYIPWNAFDGLVRNGSPKTTNMWRNTFNNTQLVGECPKGTTQYITHYEGIDTTDFTLWNGKVACIDTKPMKISLVVFGNVYQYPYPNPIYLSYNTGWFNDSEGIYPMDQLALVPATYDKSFAGFYTGENATGDQIINPDGKINDGYLTFTTEETQLYAAFSNEYTVTYNCGEGTGNAPKSEYISIGRLFKPQQSACVRFGYRFDGWAVSGTNDVLEADREVIWPYGESKTLTARWSGDNTVCEPGYYHRAADITCALCPAGSYCEGGTFAYDGDDHGIENCPLSETSFAGADESGDCGRVLHIGNNQLYLRSDRKTEHTLNVKIGNKIYYANMSTEDVPMTAGAAESLKINLNGTSYSVYDDSPRVSGVEP